MKKVKPRIKYVVEKGWWECSDGQAPFTTSCGPTPQKAYHYWLISRVQYPAFISYSGVKIIAS